MAFILAARCAALNIIYFPFLHLINTTATLNFESRHYFHRKKSTSWKPGPLLTFVLLSMKIFGRKEVKSVRLKKMFQEGHLGKLISKHVS